MANRYAWQDMLDRWERENSRLDEPCKDCGLRRVAHANETGETERGCYAFVEAGE